MKTESLPEVLRQFQPRLEEALATPMLATWDDEESYHAAQQPHAVMRALVKAIHVELVNARIGVVFRKTIKKRDRLTLAQASKVGGKLEYFSNFDLLIEVNWEAWTLLEPEKKLALIDHELCHFAKDVTEKGETRYMLVMHDVEEFSGIVKRWGLWKNDLKQFANVLRSSGQLDAFTPEEPEPVKAEEHPKGDKVASTRTPRGQKPATVAGNSPFGLGRGFSITDLDAIRHRCHVLPWTGCWIWMGDASMEGYGRIDRVIDGRRRTLLMHRVSFAAANQRDPLTMSENVCIRHTCDTPMCVNPDHLLEGTWADNTRDAIERGRHAFAYEEVDGRIVGTCAKGHDLAAAGIKIQPNGHRQCRGCIRASHQRRTGAAA